MSIRIGGGQGFYGDSVSSIRTLLDAGVDYLCLEALAELTLAILQKDRQRDPSTGFTRDLPFYLGIAMPYVAQGGTKVITNAGGINPSAAAESAVKVAASLGLSGLRIAVVTGDDLSDRLDELAPANMDTGASFAEFPGPALFASAYLGAQPIVDALRAGADIVITGRVADPSLFLAPLIHEFGWSHDDLLAAGIAIGHLLECAGQSTGGNYSGDWWTIPEPWNFAYPIAEVEADGTAVITKAAGTGGRVSFDTVRHQLLYEIHDPSGYITPDVVADFTTLRLDDLGDDQVRVSGVTGRPATSTYKALLCHPAGYAGEARVAFGWPDAYAKAHATYQIFRRRVELAGHPVAEWHQEYWGVNALHGPTVPLDGVEEAPEVILRAAWRCADRQTALMVGREMVPLGLSAPPPGMTTTGRGVARPSELLGLWPSLVNKPEVDQHVTVEMVTA